RANSASRSIRRLLIAMSSSVDAGISFETAAHEGGAGSQVGVRWVP
ncbi:MAG: hypothetical protein ACI9A1_001985, partial [Lentimonas sp.]